MAPPLLLGLDPPYERGSPSLASASCLSPLLSRDPTRFHGCLLLGACLWPLLICPAAFCSLHYLRGTGRSDRRKKSLFRWLSPSPRKDRYSCQPLSFFSFSYAYAGHVDAKTHLPALQHDTRADVVRKRLPRRRITAHTRICVRKLNRL